MPEPLQSNLNTMLAEARAREELRADCGELTEAEIARNAEGLTDKYLSPLASRTDDVFADIVSDLMLSARFRQALTNGDGDYIAAAVWDRAETMAREHAENGETP